MKLMIASDPVSYTHLKSTIRSVVSGTFPKPTPAIWGVSITFSIRHNGCSGGSGSGSHTSRTAPYRWPDDSTPASTSALTNVPRPTFTSSASLFMARRAFSSRRPAVSLVWGRLHTTR